MNQNKKERNYTNYSPVSSEDNDDTPNRIVSSLNKNRESNQSSNLYFSFAFKNTKLNCFDFVTLLKHST